MSQRIRILVADDDEFFRRVIINMIRNSGNFPGAVFIEAADGLQAWNLVKDDPPDIAVLDVVMPNMDGTELSAKLKEKFPKLPILIVTGHDDALNKQALVDDLGVDSYLLKDKDMAEFIKELTRVNFVNLFNHH